MHSPSNDGVADVLQRGVENGAWCERWRRHTETMTIVFVKAGKGQHGIAGKSAFGRTHSDGP